METGKVSFQAYGLTDFGFWLNTFISSTKAYFLNGATEIIVLESGRHEHRGQRAVAPARPNWRLWSYDLATNQATLVDGLDWNAGAAYSASTKTRALLLVPSGDYSDTGVYDISDPASPVHLLDTRGWSSREGGRYVISVHPHQQ